jgi:hypothetical protein
MLEDTYGKVITLKMQVYRWHKRFHLAMRVSKMTHAAGNHQLQQMAKTSSMCAMLCQLTDERVFRKYQWKWEYQLETFKVFILHKDLNSWFLLQQCTHTILIGGQKVPFQTMPWNTCHIPQTCYGMTFSCFCN